MGAADMVSVYVRETLIQLATPDDVRGRVNAVNMVFVGRIERAWRIPGRGVGGVDRRRAGRRHGGTGHRAVTLLWARLFPSLRRARHLDGPPAQD